MPKRPRSDRDRRRSVAVGIVQPRSLEDTHAWAELVARQLARLPRVQRWEWRPKEEST